MRRRRDAPERGSKLAIASRGARLGLQRPERRSARHRRGGRSTSARGRGARQGLIGSGRLPRGAAFAQLGQRAAATAGGRPHRRQRRRTSVVDALPHAPGTPRRRPRAGGCARAGWPVAHRNGGRAPRRGAPGALQRAVRHHHRVQRQQRAHGVAANGGVSPERGQRPPPGCPVRRAARPAPRRPRGARSARPTPHPPRGSTSRAAPRRPRARPPRPAAPTRTPAPRGTCRGASAPRRRARAARAAATSRPAAAAARRPRPVSGHRRAGPRGRARLARQAAAAASVKRAEDRPAREGVASSASRTSRTNRAARGAWRAGRAIHERAQASRAGRAARARARTEPPRAGRQLESGECIQSRAISAMASARRNRAPRGAELAGALEEEADRRAGAGSSPGPGSASGPTSWTTSPPSRSTSREVTGSGPGGRSAASPHEEAACDRRGRSCRGQPGGRAIGDEQAQLGGATRAGGGATAQLHAERGGQGAGDVVAGHGVAQFAEHRGSALASRRATSSQARRVLPMPPRPISVTRRAPPANASCSEARSCSRPRKASW